MFRYSIIFILALLALMPFSASANLSIHNVDDWKYRFYICKDAMTYLLVLEDLRSENKINQADYEEGIIRGVMKHQNIYPFDKGDAQWIALMASSVRTGLLETGQKLDAVTVTKQGFNVCVGMFDKMGERLKESAK